MGRTHGNDDDVDDSDGENGGGDEYDGAFLFISPRSCIACNQF